TLRCPSSPAPLLLTGKPSVVQTLTDVAPGRPDATFLHTSSILTIALPFASCPVITRRTFSAMPASSNLADAPRPARPPPTRPRAAARMIDLSLKECSWGVAEGQVPGGARGRLRAQLRARRPCRQAAERRCLARHWRTSRCRRRRESARASFPRGEEWTTRTERRIR